MRIFVQAFGCSSSLADGEVLRGCLAKGGHDLVNCLRDADLVVYNTCAVKSPTENRMINLLKRVPPDTKLVVAGCLPLINRARLRREVRFDGMVGPACGEDIVDVVNHVGSGKHVEQLAHAQQSMPQLDLARVRVNSKIGVIPICYGCVGACAYCCVRTARGALRSYPVTEIVATVERDVAAGIQEFWLTAQDTAAYGGTDGSDLAQLLSQVCTVEGDFLVRVGMMTPSSVLHVVDELAEAFKPAKVFKFLHLPVQSGDNEVLQRMNRRYSVEEFMVIVDRFREAFPRLTLATDVIVGFPGETDAAFRRTLDLLDDVQPDIVNVSKFFARPGTAAVELTPKIPRAVVNRRSAQLARRAGQITRERNRAWLRWRGEILVDEVGTPGSAVGRNFSYKPIVVKGREVGGLVGHRIAVQVVAACQSHLVGARL